MDLLPPAAPSQGNGTEGGTRFMTINPSLQRSGIIMFAVLAIMLLSTSVNTFAQAVAEQPVLITSIGQSPEVLTARILADQAGLEYKYDQLATAADLDGVKSVVMSVGVSMKGFGAAGVDRNTEERRARELLSAAKAQGIKVVFLFTGGAERDGERGPLSMHFVELTAHEADALIVLADINEDGYFTDISSKTGAPLHEMNIVLDLRKVYETVYGL